MPESATSSDYLEEARQNLRRTIYYFIYAFSFTAGLLLLFVSQINIWPERVGLLAIIVLSSPLLPWLVMGRWPRVTPGLLVLLYLGIAALFVAWFDATAALALLALPIGMSTLLIHPRWGLALTFISSFVALGGAGLLSPPSGETLTIILGLIWGVQVLTWAAVRFVHDGMQWSWWNYQRNAALLERARDQRVELKQAQEDLMKANVELARLSDRLQAMRLAAEEARRAKEEFVANVSHEFRTPLNMIIGFSEMIAQAPHIYGRQIPPALLADIGVILRNSKHLASLVDDVLDLSRAELSPTGLERQWTRLSSLLHEAEQAVRPLFESKGLYLESEIPPNEPEIYCDITRIRQVILNLLSNAARFTERGGVTVKLGCEQGRVVMAIRDTGPGISPEDQERIFEPFRQAGDRILRRHGGSGLGLTLSKRFVELHGGKMWLKSELGKGSTFYFSLPRDMGHPLEVGARRWINPYANYEVRARPSKAPIIEVKPRYVVLEPTPALHRIIQRYQDGIEVRWVRTCQQALEEITRAPARALIVNQQTEPPEGLTWLASLPYGTPAIVCRVPDVTEVSQQLGVNHYLIKPVRRQALQAALDGLDRKIHSLLVVDDDPQVVQLLSRMLDSFARDYRIYRALSGTRALELLRQHHPDAMLLDLIMPGMSGEELLQQKVQDPAIRDIPVIAVSGQDPISHTLGTEPIAITKGGGLTLGELLALIRESSRLLEPSPELLRRAHV